MRIAAMAVVAVCVLGLLALLILRGQTARMALLYGDLDLRESGQITEQLDRAHIAYDIEAQGTRLLVAADQVTRARMLLARNGLPSGGIIGNEIFDRADALTATQAQQALNETRALEGELARTIQALSGVRAARVHLVLPRREPFARAEREAQASVMLTMTGVARLDQESVQAILNLIAAAVPGLRATNIALIDSRGNLLARAGQPSAAAALSHSTEELRHATELRLARSVEEMLEGTLGPGRVRAEASVEMAFDQVRETQEKYDPEGQVMRSQQTVSDNNRSTEQNPSVSVQNNLPNADAGANPAGSQSARQEETTNYEIGKTVRTLVSEQPQIHRLSLAVMVDGVTTRQANGSIEWHERSAEELARIATLVKSAVGFDEKRGDHVEVVGMRFTEIEPAAAPERGVLFGLEKPDVMRLAETGLLCVVAVLALLLVGRPMALRLAGPRLADAVSAALEGDVSASGLGFLNGPQAAGGVGGGAPGVMGSPAIAGIAQAALSGPDSLVNVGNIDGQMRASMLRQVAQLAELHPEETLSLVRGWMQEGEAH